MKIEKVILVIVTFNRKELLKRLLLSIQSLDVKPSRVVIVNNGSTDGTDDVINSLVNNPSVNFLITVVNQRNLGAAGGFKTGISKALEYDPKFVWLMDDDGFPHHESLKYLLMEAKEQDDVVLASVCLSDTCKQKDELSFQYNCDDGSKIKSYSELLSKFEEKGFIEKWASFYNSILIGANAIKKIGLPKSEMFMWGDEVEYFFRFLKNSKISVKTIVKSIQFHPCNRQIFKFSGKLSVLDVPVDWRFFNYYRNKYYLNSIAGAKLRGVSALLKDTISVLVLIKRKRFKALYLLLKSFNEGAFNNYKTGIPFK